MKYAILLDGGFVIKKLQKSLKRFPSSTDIVDKCQQTQTHPSLASGELYRIYFYHANPAKDEVTNPLSKQKIALGQTQVASQHQSLLDHLEMEDDFAIRLGETTCNGWEIGSSAMRAITSGKKNDVLPGDLRPSLSQKGVDLRIGLDIAKLALQRLVDVIVVVSGDSDLVPALKFARREGLRIFLDHMDHGVRRDLKVHCDRIL